jgi:hypothetical protein
VSKQALEARQAEASRRRRADKEYEAGLDEEAEFDRKYPPSEYRPTTGSAREFGAPLRATPVAKKAAASESLAL